MLAQGGGCARADRGHSWKLTAAARGELAGAARTGDDDPVVAGDVDRGRAGGYELDQRAEHDLEPEPLEPLGECAGLLPGPRDDDAQGLGGGSRP